MSAHPDGKIFVPCTRRDKCSRCGKVGMCSRTSDGSFEICYRVGTEEGLEKTGRLGTYWVYRTDNAPVRGTKIEHDLGGGELAKPDDLGRVYYDLLCELTLGDGHRGQLQARGLTDEQIARFGFRSWPEPARVASIANMLYRKHGDLCARIPGWVLRDQRPWLVGWPGILIPIFDLANNVIAIHVRRDLAEGDDGPKYVWMSSVSYDGPSPGSQPFLCFPKGLYKKGEEVDFPEVWLVEGEFKAIAVSEKTGKAAVSIPGVSLYGLALPMLESVKAKRICMALDADWASNRYVAQAILRTWLTLRERGYDITVADWEIEWGKGIDDVYQAGHKPKLLHDRECWPFLARLSIATGLYDNGVTNKKSLPRAIPSVSPSQAKNYLEHFVPGIHNPYELALVDAYILTERSEPILRNNLREAIKRKLSRVKDWDDQVAQRKKLLDQFFAWDRLQRDKSDPEKHQAPEKLFPNSPLPVGYCIPDPYRVDEQGVHRMDFSKGEEGDVVRVCATPAFPTARLQDIAMDAHSLCLSWWRDGIWKHKVFPQTQLASAREIVQLADNDFPVDSQNAGEIVSYLRDSRERNLDALPRIQVTSHLGWQGRDGEHGFLVGLQRARPDGALESTRMYDLAPGKWGSDQLVFRGQDRGDDQAVLAYRSEGTMEGWLQAIEPVINYPRVLLVLYASMAAPLLEILKAPPFTIDLSYTTSAGKTTALRVAASVWGTPDERDPNPVIRSWENTRVFVERSLAMCNGLPLIMDDTARAHKPEAISKVVYDVSSGSGKGRGSKTGGISQSGSWRTILLSTGEQKITNFAELGGAHTRALCLWGPPFNKQNAEAGAVVSKIHRGLLANHGHAGPLWAAWILSNRQHWPVWREQFRALQEAYAKQAGDNAVANRFSEYFAVLMLTSILAHEALPLPWDAPRDPFKDLREDILREAKEADRARLAREFILGWVASQPLAFWNKNNASVTGETRPQMPPPGGWLGRWDFDPDVDQSREKRHPYVAIYTHQLKSKLEQAGHHFETTLRTWRDRGWLEHEDERLTRLVRVDRVRTRMVCLRTLSPDEGSV